MVRRAHRILPLNIDLIARTLTINTDPLSTRPRLHNETILLTERDPSDVTRSPYDIIKTFDYNF